MKTIRFEVLPDEEGGWNVTRDRIVTAGFDRKLHAVRHALKCCLTSAMSGMAAKLLVVGEDGTLHQDRSFSPVPCVAQPQASDSVLGDRAQPLTTN